MEPSSSIPSVRLFKQCLIVLDDRQLKPKSLLHFLRSHSIIPEDVSETMAHIHLEFSCPASISSATQWLETGRHLMLSSTFNICTLLEEMISSVHNDLCLIIFYLHSPSTSLSPMGAPFSCLGNSSGGGRFDGGNVLRIGLEENAVNRTLQIRHPWHMTW